MSDINTLIRNRVQAFVDDLTQLVRRAAVESVATALGGNGAARPRARPAPAARAGRARRKGKKRGSRELEALTARLRDQIAKMPGTRIEPIAKAMGISTRELALPVRKLLESGTIRKKGVKRSTQYFAQ
jgi:hypothetical protein